MAPKGQQQKTELDSSPTPQQKSGRRVDSVSSRKRAEVSAIRSTDGSWLNPVPAARPQTALTASTGNVSLQSRRGEGEVTLIIKKTTLNPNSSVTLVFNLSGTSKPEGLNTISTIAGCRTPYLGWLTYSEWHQPRAYSDKRCNKTTDRGDSKTQTIISTKKNFMSANPRGGKISPPPRGVAFFSLS